MLSIVVWILREFFQKISKCIGITKCDFLISIKQYNPQCYIVWFVGVLPETYVYFFLYFIFIFRGGGAPATCLCELVRFRPGHYCLYRKSVSIYQNIYILHASCTFNVYTNIQNRCIITIRTYTSIYCREVVDSLQTQ